MTLNAVKKGEINNSVEYAFLHRPNSPNFRIYSDKDVNGVQKSQNFVGLKYEEFLLEQQEQNFYVNMSEASADVASLYCLCRRPYDPKQDSPRWRMFQCEGPCRKWVHPYCFGETYSQINEYENKDTSYFCTFCSPDEASKYIFRNN